jgi:hypothetical protein
MRGNKRGSVLNRKPDLLNIKLSLQHNYNIMIQLEELEPEKIKAVKYLAERISNRRMQFHTEKDVIKITLEIL